MIIFKYAWELVKVVGWATGIVIGGMLMLYAFFIVMGVVVGGFFLLGHLAIHQPLIGVPLLLLAVLFCLWCAYFQQNASNSRQPTVLRGPFVVTSDQQFLHVRIQRGGGAAQAESEDNESPRANQSSRL